MRHAATALSLCIALIGGFVLALVWGQPPLRSSSIQAVPSTDIEETALAFYRAVNIYLDSGDEASLRRLLHPDFVNHGPGSLAGGNAASFIQQLDSIRGLYAGIQLEPEIVYLGDNTASVSLSFSDQQRHELAGIGIDAVAVVGRFDLVRVERRRIAERWSSAPLAGELDAYPALSIDLPLALNRLVARVQQISLDGASDPTVNPFGHLLLIVQSGDVRLEVVKSATIPTAQWQMEDGWPTDPAPIVPGVTVTLDQMEAVLLPAGTQFRVWDDGSPGADVLALEFGPPVSGEGSPPLPILDGPGATLWSGISLSGVGKRLTISFGHATLLPQATLSSPEVEGMALTWVSGGSFEMSVSRGTMRVRDAGGLRSQPNDGIALLQAGDAGTAGPGSDIAYRVTGSTSAMVWFFSILPAGAEASENGGGAPTASPTPPPPRTAS